MDTIISSAIQQQQELIALKIQTSIMKTTMNVQKEVGEAIISLIENAANPGKTRGKALGLGANFDAFA